jgi:hypothetical protein
MNDLYTMLSFGAPFILFPVLIIVVFVRGRRNHRRWMNSQRED